MTTEQTNFEREYHEDQDATALSLCWEIWKEVNFLQADIDDEKWRKDHEQRMGNIK